MASGENHRSNEHNLGHNTDTAHAWRYYLARGFIEPGDVINDVACGYGYGTAILARSTASLVRGFDYEPGVIEDARADYGNSKTIFDVMDFDKDYELPLADYTVSIETIEHLDDPEVFARSLKLSTRRYIFLTTPIVPTTKAALGDELGSPYHHHDFSLVSLDNLFVDEEWDHLHDSVQGGTHGIIVFVNRKWLSQWNQN